MTSRLAGPTPFAGEAEVSSQANTDVSGVVYMPTSHLVVNGAASPGLTGPVTFADSP